MSDEPRHEEIIIIKRGGEEDEGHHGGAWKIAFADFMTAMMALFLVLWLINAANEETKKSVASYFNPVKLVDRNRSSKGLLESSGPQVSTEENADAPITGGKPVEGTKEDSGTTAADEAALAKKPLEVLERIASRPAGAQSAAMDVHAASSQASPSTETKPVDRYRDPFDPDFWKAEVGIAEGASQDPPSHENAQAPETTPDQEAKTASTPAHDVSAPGSERHPAPNAQAQGADNSTVQDDAEKLSAEIKQAFAHLDGVDPDLPKSLEVVNVKGGILISMTDNLNTPMFELGSALPSRDMVLAMAKIGALLSRTSGNIRFYGHTDSRRYRAGNYDNWQLSVARAQTAYFMLVRGGLDKARVSQISGFADSQPKNSLNPEDPVNRRIEIMLETKS